MAKILPLAIGGVGLTGAAVGGVYLTGKGGGTGKGTTAPGETDPNPGTSTASEPTLLWDTLDAFKTTRKDKDCVKDYFTGIDLNMGGSELSATSKPDGTSAFFKTSPASNEINSCLIVNWKKTKTDNKGTGKFIGLWTFKKGNEGFVNFVIAEPKAEDTSDKVNVTGGFYLVQKKTDGSNNWEAKYKKEVKDTPKEVSSTDLVQYIPKAKDVKGDLSDYGNFSSENPTSLEGDCTGDQCSELKTNGFLVKRGRWATSSSAEKFIKDWSDNLDWWEKIYEAKAHWDLPTKLDQIKGAGTLQTS